MIEINFVRLEQIYLLLIKCLVYKMSKHFPEPKVMSSNVFFSDKNSKPKDIQSKMM